MIDLFVLKVGLKSNKDRPLQCHWRPPRAQMCKWHFMNKQTNRLMLSDSRQTIFHYFSNKFHYRWKKNVFKGRKISLLFINAPVCVFISVFLHISLSLYAVTALSPQRKMDLMTPAYWKTSKVIM